ncbi:MAG: hypothetical protein AAF846_17120 [Chloroflexota bacterium]
MLHQHQSQSCNMIASYHQAIALSDSNIPHRDMEKAVEIYAHEYRRANMRHWLLQMYSKYNFR